MTKQSEAQKSEYLTYREAAEELGVTVQYVTHLVSQKRFRSEKFPGSRVKYLRRDDVERYARIRAGLEAPSGREESRPVSAAPVAPFDILEGVQHAVQSIDLQQQAGLSTQFVLATDLAPFILRAYALGQTPATELLAQVTDDAVRQQLHGALIDFAKATAS